MLSNTLSLNFCCLKIIHTCYHAKIIGHILKSKQNNKCICIHEIIRNNHNENEDENKKIENRCDINRPRSRHKKYDGQYDDTYMFKQRLSNI